MHISNKHELKASLAYAYRLCDYLGFADHIYTHLSARPDGADYFYIYPFGYRFQEVTADCLLKVSLDGKILDGKILDGIDGSSDTYNRTGYVIHSGIYRARKDVNTIFHLHTIASVAVSAMKDGLLPISQWALHFYNQIAYHEYNALALDDISYSQHLAKDLATQKVMFLRNHGFITCGYNIAEAMFYSYHLEQACKTQIAALSCGTELVMPSHAICEQANQELLSFEPKVGQKAWQAWLKLKL